MHGVHQCPVDDAHSQVLVEVRGGDGLGVLVGGEVGCPRGVGEQGKGCFQQGDAVSRQDAFFDCSVGSVQPIVILILPPHLDFAAPPTLTTFASRSCNFMLSNSLAVGSAMMLLICLQRAWMESFDPSPLSTIVSSFVMVMDSVELGKSMVAHSSLMSSSSVNMVPPVKMAESLRIDLQLSPNPGGSLDDRDLKLTTELVRDASSQRLAIDVFRYDDQRDSRLGGGLERRQYILQQGYLPPAQQDSNYFWLLTSVMKYGLTNPRSNRIPSVISISSSMG